MVLVGHLAQFPGWRGVYFCGRHVSSGFQFCDKHGERVQGRVWLRVGVGSWPWWIPQGGFWRLCCAACFVTEGSIPIPCKIKCFGQDGMARFLIPSGQGASVEPWSLLGPKLAQLLVPGSHSSSWSMDPSRLMLAPLVKDRSSSVGLASSWMRWLGKASTLAQHGPQRANLEHT